MDFETFPVKDTVRLVASLLQQITLANDHRTYTPASPVSPTSSPPLHSLSSFPSTPTTSCSSSSSSSHRSTISNPYASRSHIIHNPSPKYNITPSSTSASTPTSMEPSLSSSSSSSSSLQPSVSQIPPAFSRFHAQTVPSISILSYLNRILKYAPCSNCVFISILVYIDRMARAKLPFMLCSPNVHRSIIVCVMVATKFASDVFYTNAHYAKVGGLQLMELNQLELEFLFMNEFNLLITLDEFQFYAKRLMDHAIQEQKRAAALSSPFSALWFPNLASVPPPPPPPSPLSPEHSNPFSPSFSNASSSSSCSSSPSSSSSSSSSSFASSSVPLCNSPFNYLKSNLLTHHSNNPIPPPPPPSSHPSLSTRKQLRRFSSHPIVTAPSAFDSSLTLSSSIAASALSSSFPSSNSFRAPIPSTNTSCSSSSSSSSSSLSITNSDISSTMPNPNAYGSLPAPSSSKSSLSCSNSSMPAISAFLPYAYPRPFYNVGYGTAVGPLPLSHQQHQHQHQHQHQQPHPVTSNYSLTHLIHPTSNVHLASHPSFSHHHPHLLLSSHAPQFLPFSSIMGSTSNPTLTSPCLPTPTSSSLISPKDGLTTTAAASTNLIPATATSTTTTTTHTPMNHPSTLPSSHTTMCPVLVSPNTASHSSYYPNHRSLSPMFATPTARLSAI